MATGTTEDVPQTGSSVDVPDGITKVDVDLPRDFKGRIAFVLYNVFTPEVWSRSLFQQTFWVKTYFITVIYKYMITADLSFINLRNDLCFTLCTLCSANMCKVLSPILIKSIINLNLFYCQKHSMKLQVKISGIKPKTFWNQSRIWNPLLVYTDPYPLLVYTDPYPLLVYTDPYKDEIDISHIKLFFDFVGVPGIHQYHWEERIWKSSGECRLWQVNISSQYCRVMFWWM